MSSDKSESTKMAEEDRKTLGQRLKSAREYIGFSQEEVSSYLNVPRSALSLMETGQRKVAALELKELARLYKKPLGYFTGEEPSDATFGANVAHLARKVSGLSPDDQQELERFADFLRARKQEKEG